MERAKFGGILGAALVGATGAWAYLSYRRELRWSARRLQGASKIMQTRCGPIEYAEAGEGTPLLVVHGAGGGFDQGLEIAHPLEARGFRIVAPSRFGYLRTALPGDASPAAQADAHAALLDALGIPRAAVLGVSAGGPSAMQFAVRHPERCTALVLMVPLAYKPSDVPSSAPERSALSLKVLTWIVGSDFLFWLGLKFAHNLMVRTALGTPPECLKTANSSERTRVEQILTHILPVSRRARGLMNETRIATALPRFALEKIKAPTLLLSLRDDLYGTFAGAEYSATQIPGARFVGYENGGHMFVGRHDEATAEIENFLRANTARANLTQAASAGSSSR